MNKTLLLLLLALSLIVLCRNIKKIPITTCKDSLGKAGEPFSIITTDNQRINVCLTSPQSLQTATCFIEYDQNNAIVNEIPPGCSTNPS